MLYIYTSNPIWEVNRHNKHIGYLHAFIIFSKMFALYAFKHVPISTVKPLMAGLPDERPPLIPSHNISLAPLTDP